MLVRGQWSDAIGTAKDAKNAKEEENKTGHRWGTDGHRLKNESSVFIRAPSVAKFSLPFLLLAALAFLAVQNSYR
jgi:hypothetical protein